jgi:hypothetical protein
MARSTPSKLTSLADDNAAAYGSFGHLNNVFEQKHFHLQVIK